MAKTLRDERGRFMSRESFERTYGMLEQGVSVDLNDPEVQETIRDISGPPRPHTHYQPIHNIFYLIWLFSTAFAVFVAFFLGSLVYR
jgi:hypothetical protein